MKQNRTIFKRTPLCSMILAVLASMQSHSAYAESKTPTKLAQAEFNDQFLQRKGGKSIDLSRFSNENPVQAGTYRSDIYVNEGWLGRSDVVFRPINGDPNNVKLCVDRAFLQLAGVDFEKLTPETITALSNATSASCLQIGDLIPDATAMYDTSDLRLDVTIPQISLRKQARGYVNPEFWDRGVTAGILGYNFNGYRISSPGAPSNTSYYLGLNGGVNLGDWRLRNMSAVTRQGDGKTHYQNTATYLQRDVTSLKSQLIVGDTFTTGRFFDSFSFRGVSLSSDDRMLPDSQSGYAPVVRGVARSNAKVTVTQNGNILYETTVTPGQFEINDLYPTGYGGDLNVTVTEADGSRSSFVVPYASVTQMLRPDMSRYSVNAGRTRDNNSLVHANFTQATYERGISNDVTLFGGVLAASDYLAALGGGAFNSPIGAFSLSVTQSHAKLSAQETRSGQSYRVDYNKLLPNIGTNFALAAYRYSSSGYLRLQDMLAAKEFQARGFGAIGQLDRQRSQLQLIINQSLGDRNGFLYVSGSTQNFWNRPGSATQYQAGYSNSWRSVNYNFNIQRQRDLTSGATSTQYFASVSFPLGRETSSPLLTNTVVRDPQAGTTLQSTLTGAVGSDNAISYGATVAKSPASKSASVNGQYRTPYANLGASYGHSNNGSSQMSMQASGAVIAHPGGVTLAQSIGETIGIVEARDAEGAAVNTAGVRVDGRGYAVVPYMTPYRLNEVAIDPKGMSTDTELAVTSQRVAPRAGAVVMMTYPTVTGRSVLIHVKMPGGETVPFGAEVLDEQGNAIGMAGQGGRVFVRTATADTGRLTLKWGQETSEQCTLTYHLPPRVKDAKGVVFDTTDAQCLSPSKMAERRGGADLLGKGHDQTVVR